MKPKVCIIYWEDACHSEELMDVDEAVDIEPLRCADVGFLIENTKNKIVLASTMDEDNQVRFINVIPKKYIQKIEYVKVRGIK